MGQHYDCMAHEKFLGTNGSSAGNWEGNSRCSMDERAKTSREEIPGPMRSPWNIVSQAQVTQTLVFQSSQLP